MDATSLRRYQRDAINFQTSKRISMLWVDMGLGKTAISLFSINHLLKAGFIKGVLIVAPSKVCKLVWRQESEKWDELKGLSFSHLYLEKKLRPLELKKPSNCYLVNYENLPGLVTLLQDAYGNNPNNYPFDAVIFDEITKLKQPSGQRFKAAWKITKGFTWRSGLTGTPAPNGYQDVFGPYLMLDRGARLGRGFCNFKKQYFKEFGMSHKLEPHDWTCEKIKSKIRDVTLELSAKDYLDMPPINIIDLEVSLSEPLAIQYRVLENKMFATIDDVKIVAVNKAASMNKCLQYSNGAMYDKDGISRIVHDEKLEALEMILESCSDENVLCAYQFRSDAVRILERFKSFGVINLTDCKTENSLNHAIQSWRNRECRLMIGHPASMGHGIDGLQNNCKTLVWFGLTWSMELYNQFNSRISRFGQSAPVSCYRIITKNTVDMIQKEVLASKKRYQDALRDSINLYKSKLSSPYYIPPSHSEIFCNLDTQTLNRHSDKNSESILQPHAFHLLPE